jgi:hypothetical protein
VFTPTEYGAVGLSEEDAIKTFGQDNVEVFLTEFTSLELQASSRKHQLLVNKYIAMHSSLQSLILLRSVLKCTIAEYYCCVDMSVVY